MTLTGAGAVPVLPEARPHGRATSAGHAFNPFGDDGLTFRDLLDAINPLQHIPLIGGLYRRMTHASISPASRVLGGALYGGVIGAIASVISAVAEYESGKDLDEQALTAFDGGKDAASSGAQTTAVAGRAPERPGGWMINAAYGAQVAESSQRAGAANPGQPAVPAAPRQRPGGWIVNAAYAGFDAYQRSPALRTPEGTVIDVTA